MTRAEFEAACLREGYEVGEGEIQAHVRRQPHAHDFDARLFVVDGSLPRVRGEDRVTYGPGEVCAVPAGTGPAEHTEADGARLVYGRRTVARAHPAR
jgi:hypothetical protein